MWISKKKVSKPKSTVYISHQDFSRLSVITFGIIEDGVVFPIKDKGKKVAKDYCDNIEFGKVDKKDIKIRHAICIGKEEGRMAWKGQDGSYIEGKEKDINGSRETVVLEEERGREPYVVEREMVTSVKTFDSDCGASVSKDVVLQEAEFEDTDAEYMEMVAVMGVSFKATNGEVLAMIKDNVEAPANNMADDKELLNDAQATDNI
ncbi:hypothetical protein AMTR_s00072p00064860 [Amborella trichopoda]|uniref:Uncharacterized protein n=1 Tax=Amborella trichopoda TaxID=13333 RepID=W1NTE4_AMBTC|nr:hypothetical protein AMTR_s00072p00064860 [Amborella trichopoda]